jgi:hypothetical protein
VADLFPPANGNNCFVWAKYSPCHDKFQARIGKLVTRLNMLSAMTAPILDQLRSLPLKKSADAAFRKALTAGDAFAFQHAFMKEQAKVRNKLNKVLEENQLAARWSAQTPANLQADDQLLVKLADSAPAAICQDIANTFSTAPGTGSAFQSLLAAEALMRYPAEFTPEQFALVYVNLATSDLSSTASDATVGDEDSCPAISDIMTQGELPYVLSLLFAPLQCSKLLRAKGLEYLADFLESSTDTDGTLHADLSANLTKWLAPFVRVQTWSKVFKEPWARAVTLTRWNLCLTQIGALTITSGFLPESISNDDVPHGHSLELLTRAIELTELRTDSSLPALLKSLSRGLEKKHKPSQNSDVPSSQSDWAATALLRNTLTADADAIFVTWNLAGPNLKVVTRGSEFSVGGLQNQITVDGKTVVPAGNWVCTCWFQDNDVAFAELEAGSEDCVRHVIHIMLALKEQFAVITTTVSAPSAAANIRVENGLSLSESFTAHPNPVTREIRFSDGRVDVRAIPCWLPDDRIQGTAGNFEIVKDDLISTAENRGGVVMPVLLDWHPDRKHREADWNRLTVTEERRVNSAFEAQAFRVRAGMLQLLLYRSLRRGETLRTVLGYHSDSETVYGHVQNSGKIEAMVLVESDA